MKAQPILMYMPSQRDVMISPYSCGNSKVGWGVFTYDRVAGRAATCPGATVECEDICYAKRVRGVLFDEVWVKNMLTSEVPPIPPEAKVLRIHISGDFDSISYIQNWHRRLLERPDVKVWAYTRSWRVTHLLPALEALRTLPNLQLFASMDPSCTDTPPPTWRRAWIDRPAGGRWPHEARLYPSIAIEPDVRNQIVLADRTASYVCPEETGDKRDCMDCGYCMVGVKKDVTFIEHHAPTS